MRRLGSIIATTLFLLVIYLVYTGAITTMDIVLGLIGSIIIASFTADMLIKSPGKILGFNRWLYLVAYTLLYLTIVEAKAHWSIAKIILHPKMPINPSIVRIPYDVESDYAKTTIANSITNTPGTVVVDVDDKRRVFYVHWINATTTDDEKARKQISFLFEKYAKKIFD